MQMCRMLRSITRAKEDLCLVNDTKVKKRKEKENKKGSQ